MLFILVNRDSRIQWCCFSSATKPRQVDSDDVQTLSRFANDHMCCLVWRACHPKLCTPAHQPYTCQLHAARLQHQRCTACSRHLHLQHLISEMQREARHSTSCNCTHSIAVAPQHDRLVPAVIHLTEVCHLTLSPLCIVLSYYSLCHLHARQQIFRIQHH